MKDVAALRAAVMRSPFIEPLVSSTRTAVFGPSPCATASRESAGTTTPPTSRLAEVDESGAMTACGSKVMMRSMVRPSTPVTSSDGSAAASAGAEIPAMMAARAAPVTPIAIARRARPETSSPT